RDKSEGPGHEDGAAKSALTIEFERAARLRSRRAGAVRPRKNRPLVGPHAGHTHPRNAATLPVGEAIITPQSFAHLPQQFVACLADVAGPDLRRITTTPGRAQRKCRQAA